MGGNGFSEITFLLPGTPKARSRIVFEKDN